MQRTSTMTLGFVLIFLGIQLAVIDSYVLTPRVANFLSEQGGRAPVALSTPDASTPNNVFQQAAYQAQQMAPPIVTETQRTLTPPGWLCWPMLFCGTVVFIHGFSKPRNH